MLEIVEQILKTQKDQEKKIEELTEDFKDIFLTKSLLLVYMTKLNPDICWKARRNEIGHFEEDFFILGINKDKEKTVSFYVPIRYWDNLEGIETFDVAPNYDSVPDMVNYTLRNLIQ